MVYNKSMENIKAVIFDVDGTLTNEVSWLNITQGLGADPLEHKRIFDDMRAGVTTYPQAKALLIALWQSTGNANRSFIQEMFDFWTLKHDAEETTEYLKQKYHVCLMSGAVDLYIATVARKLGIKDWYANTELIWDEQGNLIDFNYYVDQAGKKVEHFEQFAKQYGYSKEECIAIGDGDSDLLLFKTIKGIAVNAEPYPELEKLAFKKINHLGELKRLL